MQCMDDIPNGPEPDCANGKLDLQYITITMLAPDVT